MEDKNIIPTQVKNTYFDCNQPLVDEFDKIYSEYEKDCEMSYANMSEKVLSVPSIKHKWVTRLCIYRNKLYEHKRLLNRITEEAIVEHKKKSKIEISSATARKEIEKDCKIIVIKERVELLERMVEVLIDINGHMKYFNNEVSAIIEWHKMEMA